MKTDQFISLKNKEDFLSLLIGDKVVKTFAHGEDSPVEVESWVVTIEPTKAGDIPKMAIQKTTSSATDQSFFIHLNETQKIIIDDDAKVFFDFAKLEENLFGQRSN